MSDTLDIARARFASAPNRRGVRGLLAAHPKLIDVSVATIYVLILLPGLVHGVVFSGGAPAAQAGVGLATTLGAGVALLFRRRAPIVVITIILVLLLVVKTLICGLADPLGLAIAGYAAGAYLPQRRAWLATTGATLLIVLIVVIGVPLAPGALPADALLILTLVLFVPACLLGLLVNLLSRLREAEELRVIHRMQEQAQTAELAVAQERTALSREMHDVVGHSLTAIINLSDGALRASAANPETHEALEAGLRRINSIARDALGETRTILSTLQSEGETAPRSPSQSSPAPAARESERSHTELDVRELLDTAECTGLATRLIVSGEPPAGFLTEEVRGAAYRIVQEAITNTMRHAGDASRLTVSLLYAPEGLMIQVLDNGRQASSTSPGNGLRGATDRAVQLGGDLRSGPAPAGGWHLTASIPALQEAAS